MEYTLLGRTGLRVSKLALGTAVLGLVPPASESDALVHAALDAGINVFDCANTYGNRATFDRAGLPAAEQRQHAEELLGRALRGRRDEVVLCTKVSEPVGAGPNDGGLVIPGVGGRGGGLSRYHIMREVERSLARLGTDHIDVYHLHHPDPDTAIEETLQAIDDLVRQGKVRYVGLSTFSGWQLTKAAMVARAAGIAGPILNQVPYSMINRGVESEVVPAALDLGLAITCFSPLAGGALAGDAAINREHGGLKRWGLPFDYTPEQRAAGEQLGALATEWGQPAAHLALHWLLARPAVAMAVVGPESVQELQENVAMFDLRLDADQLTALDEVGRTVPAMPI